MKLNASRGVTLIELVIVLTVAAVIAGFTLAGLGSLFPAAQSRSHANDMHRLFALARQQAIMDGALVTLCPLDSDGECSKDWGRPLTVFTDPDNDRALGPGERKLRELPASKQGRWRVRPSHKRYFQFDGLGMAHGTLGNLTWCPRSGEARYAVHLIMNMGGRLRTAQDQDGDGVVEMSNGKPVQCP